MNKHNSRRDFLKKSVFATSSLMIPAFLKCSVPPAALKASQNGKILVIVQLSGGNDGLNTVVPYENDLYYNYRPTLGISKSEVLKLDNNLGLNPALSPLHNLYKDGLMTVINNVGYPNPDRSHFRSMDIWQSASGADDFLSTGWIGRYLDQQQTETISPHQALELDDTMSLALKGKINSGYAAGNLDQLKRSTNNKFLKAVSHHDHSHEGNTAYLYRTLSDTFDSADYLHDQSQIYKSSVTYPGNAFARSLKQTAELIISGSNTRIYYVSLGGFDTHANQKNQQTRMLKQYADGVGAFMKDMKANKKMEDVLVMTFSEFGRRVKQNASRGTDHGTANNLFLMGGGLKETGIYNDAPNLKNLDNGDLIYDIDYRRIYATLLTNWLGVDALPVLGNSFDLLGFC